MKPFVFQHAQDVWPRGQTPLHAYLTPHDQDRKLAALVARGRAVMPGISDHLCGGPLASHQERDVEPRVIDMAEQVARGRGANARDQLDQFGVAAEVHGAFPNSDRAPLVAAFPAELHRRRLALLEVAEGPSPPSPERPQALVAELFHPITANIQPAGSRRGAGWA